METGAGKLLWGWDSTNKVWVPIEVDADGYLRVDLSGVGLGDLGDWDADGNDLIGLGNLVPEDETKTLGTLTTGWKQLHMPNSYWEELDSVTVRLRGSVASIPNLYIQNIQAANQDAKWGPRPISGRKVHLVAKDNGGAVIYLASMVAGDPAALELLRAKLTGPLAGNDQILNKINYVELKEIAAPSTPASGYARLYTTTDGKAYLLSDSGVATVLDDIATITFIIDGGNSAITTGQKGHLEIPFGCTIQRATLLADQSGSIVIDIWRDTYANFPPTDADSITASAPPTLSGTQKSQDSTLTGWTTAITAGDILAFNVDSITDCERVTLSLKVKKT